jgi:ComEC/Rec2-related protein
MALLFGLASVLQRNVNHIHVLNVTALAFLIVRPVLLFDIGTQLSFAAVYGILFMYPKLDAVIKKGIRMRVVRLVARPMAVSLSAQIFVAPLLIHYFHRLPVYAVLANLLVVPIAATIIFLLFVCFGTGLFWYGLVEYISLPVSCLINILVVVSGLFARLPFSTVKIMVSPLLVFPLYLMVGKKMRRFVPWVMIVVAGVFSIAGSCDCLVVYTVAKGMLIITPSRESVLICMQRTSAQQICLEKNGIDELDYLMAPSPCYPVKKAFIALPGRMCYKQYWLGDLEVRLSKNIVLRFRDTEVVCALADLQSARDGGEYTYWLSNGKQQCVLRGSLFCTILEQMIFDVQIVLAQLRMLM